MREVSLKRPLFGREIEIVVFDVEAGLADDLLEEAYQVGLRLQKTFNFFDDASVLSTLNRKRSLRVPDEFRFVLERALELGRETGGAYDVSLGKQFKERKEGRKLSPLRCSYQDIKIQGDQVELTHPDACVDLGSIAKGYIADQVAGFLAEQGIVSGLVDARGDLRVFGERMHTLEIQHPRQKDAALGAIRLSEGGVATSGDYHQYHESFGTSHILNQKDFASVTVVAPTLLEADGYATALFVLPQNQITGLLAGKPHIKAVCVDQDLRLFKYNGIEELMV